MDIANNLLLWLHLIGIALGGVASFGIPVVGSRLAAAAPETRPALLGVVKGLSTVGRAGLGTLLVTGPLIAWLIYGWSGFNIWFHIKMALVVVLLAGVIYAGILLKRASGAMRRRPGRRGASAWSTRPLLLTVLAAVLAFN